MVPTLPPRALCARRSVPLSLFLACASAWLAPSHARAASEELPLAPPAAGVHLVLGPGSFRAGPPDLRAPLCRWREALGAPYARGQRWIQALAGGAEASYELRDARWSYDLALPAGVALERACFAVEGAAHLELGAHGELRVRCAAGVLEHSAPRAWARGADGTTREVGVRFALRGAALCGFEAPERSSEESLLIDPGLRWSATFGGGGDEIVHALARAADGDWILCGETRSSDLAGTAHAAQRASGGGGDAFVMRLAADGSALRWATYLGGRGAEVARALALAPDGAILVVGSTDSSDFPTTPLALHRTALGGRDAFAALLEPDGRAWRAATYLGGSGDDEALASAWVGDHPALAGSTTSADLPTSGSAFQRAPRGGLDGFVFELSSDLAQSFAGSYCGGSGRDEVRALLFDGELALGGVTESADLPSTPGALQPAGRGADLFVARFAPGLGAPRALSYFGGSGAEHELALASDGRGRLALGTSSASDDLPIAPGAFAPSRASTFAPDAYLAVLDADLTQVLASTYFGGTGVDGLSDLAFGPSGELLAVGLTLSSNLPRTAGALQTAHASLTPFARHDAWIARFDAQLRELAYASFLGGSAAELAPRVAWDPEGDAFFAGSTASLDFPRLGSPLNGLGGGGLDLCVARIDLLPEGMERYGRASVHAEATPLLWANEPPRSGSASFRLGLRGAGPHAPGLHLFAPRAAAGPWYALGVELWLDPAPPAFLLAFASDVTGAFELALAAPHGLAGQAVHVQALAWDPVRATASSSAGYLLTLR